MAYNDYNEKVLEHFNNPRNVGRLDKTDRNVGTGIAENPTKGDLIRFQVLVGPDGAIAEAKFKAYGCGSAIACASVLSTLIIGLSAEEAERPRHAEIMQLLDLPPDKMAYATLAQEALMLALADFRGKQDAKPRKIATRKKL